MAHGPDASCTGHLHPQFSEGEKNCNTSRDNNMLSLSKVPKINETVSSTNDTKKKEIHGDLIFVGDYI